MECGRGLEVVINLSKKWLIMGQKAQSVTTTTAPKCAISRPKNQKYLGRGHYPLLMPLPRFHPLQGLFWAYSPTNLCSPKLRLCSPTFAWWLQTNRDDISQRQKLRIRNGFVQCGLLSDVDKMHHAPDKEKNSDCPTKRPNEITK